MKNISETILIILLKLFFLIRKIIIFLFNIIKKITLFILNFLFFKIIIRIYYHYILVYKKIKEINQKNNSRLYFLKRNLSVFIIIILTFSVLLQLNIKKTKAQSLTNQIYKTTLAQNIKPDFDNFEPEELIIETIDDLNVNSITNTQYLESSGVLKTKSKASLDEEDSDTILSYSHGDTLSNTGLTSVESNNIRDKIIEHVVQGGETIGSIAQDFSLNVNTILWENNLSARSLIRPGDKIIILPEDGVMHTVAKNENISKIASKYGAAIDLIVDKNDLDPDEALKVGQKIFIPGGKKIVEVRRIVNQSYSGTSISRGSGTASSQTISHSTGKLLWPTNGARITQYYSWSHKGLDIANKTGTPLYAAESGTVEISGSARGYGYYVVINHGGGLKTLYAHASKLRVKAGQEVNRGDIIADMGSTGWSSGPHIHFEVRVNNVQQNPLNYISYK